MAACLTWCLRWRDAALAKITLAVTHTLAGESDAPALASVAIDAVSELRSARARADLQPLEQAPAARRDSTSAELAHRVRVARRAPARRSDDRITPNKSRNTRLGSTPTSTGATADRPETTIGANLSQHSPQPFSAVVGLQFYRLDCE